MKTILTLLFFHASLLAQAQRDTLWYDQTSGNYIVQYYVSEVDTVITRIFEPATKINPSVTVNLEHLVRVDTLIYRYTIQNGKESKQNLLYFELEYMADITDATSNGWSVGKVQQGMVVQNRWVTSDAGRWLWAGDQGLEATWHTDGFALKSKGLPSIVNAYFQGDAAEFSVAFDGPSYKISRQLAELQMFPANRVIRKTIGPVLPPNSFVALAFLDTVIAYKNQATVLGWLSSQKEDEHEREKDDGELKELDKRLAEARKALVKGDSSKARKELEGFVEKVEEIYKESVKAEEKKKGKEMVMTSEAYALLKYNAEYLIGKLPQRKSHEDGK